MEGVLVIKYLEYLIFARDTQVFLVNAKFCFMMRGKNKHTKVQFK